MKKERYFQAAEVVAELIGRRAHAPGSENKTVLGLRRQRAFSQQLASDHADALAELRDAL